MITIYVATHKKYLFPKDKGYIPFHVGKARNPTLLPYIGDNTGDSISELNESFCELTGLYWLWKNADSPIIGLVHYRRYFSSRIKMKKLYFHAIASSSDFNEFDEGYDIVLPSKVSFDNNLTIKEHYSLVHNERDMDIIREIISQRQHDYLSSFDKIMKEKEMFLCNMFISKKPVMQEYAEWLFDIILEAQKRINIDGYDAYQRRVFGFISERLFNVWIEKNSDKLLIAHRDIVEITEKTSLSKIRRYYKEKTKKLIKRLMLLFK